MESIHGAAVAKAKKIIEDWISGTGSAPRISFECWLCPSDGTLHDMIPTTPPPRGSATVETNISVWRGRYCIDLCILDSHGFILLAIEVVHTHRMGSRKLLDLLSMAPVIEVYAAPLIKGEWVLVSPMFSHPTRHPRPMLCIFHDTEEWTVKRRFAMNLIDRDANELSSSRAIKLPETLFDIEPVLCGSCGAWTCIVNLRKVLWINETSVGLWDPRWYTNGMGPRQIQPHETAIGKPLIPNMYSHMFMDSNIPWVTSPSTSLQLAACLSCKVAIPWWELSMDGTLRGLFPYEIAHKLVETIRVRDIDEKMIRGFDTKRQREVVPYEDPIAKERRTGISRFWDGKS